MSIDERKRIADILLAAVAAAAFGWVAVQRRSGATLKFDLAIRGRVHDLASPAMTAIARVLATLGSPIAVSLFFATACSRRTPRRGRPGSAFTSRRRF